MASSAGTFPVSSKKVGLLPAMEWLSQQLQSRKTESWVSTLFGDMVGSPTPVKSKPTSTIVPLQSPKLMNWNKHPYSLRPRKIAKMKQTTGSRQYGDLTSRLQQPSTPVTMTNKTTPSVGDSKTMFSDLVSLFKQTVASR